MVNRVVAQFDWTDGDAYRARNEGWRLGWISRRSMDHVHIIRHSSIPNHTSRFASREAAEKFVMEKAAESSPLHAKAVSIVVRSRLQ